MALNHLGVGVLVPLLTNNLHKGSCGRILVVGGSAEYTGAPYFAALAALRSGCDLATVVCPPSAAQAIKAYSPELIVVPFEKDETTLADHIQRAHAIVLGPGLGRSDASFATTVCTIKLSQQFSKPLVIDADALSLIATEPGVLKGHTNVVVCTPNAAEYNRLCEGFDVSSADPQTLSDALGPRTVVLRKGLNDAILIQNHAARLCEEPGSVRRYGGQGDILAGTLAAFLAWLSISCANDKESMNKRLADCCLAACAVTRRSAKLCYTKHDRAANAGAQLKFIGQAFSEFLK